MIDLVVASILFGIVFILFLICKRSFDTRRNFWKSRGITQLECDFSVRDVFTTTRSPQDCDEEYYKTLGNEKYGGIVEMGQPVLLVKDLDLIKHILVKDFDYFADRRNFVDTDPLLSKTLFFSSGQLWKDMRVKLSPTFTSGKIRRMFHHFFNSGDKLENFIRAGNELIDGGYEVDVSDAIGRYTADVIGAAVLGIDTDVLNNPDSVFLKMAKQTWNLTSLTKRLKFGMFQNMKALCNFLQLQLLDKEISNFFMELLNGIFDHRLKDGKLSDYNDFVQILIEAMKEPQTPDNKFRLSKELALPQCFGFFVAGYDTVATFLAYSVHCLAINQTVQRKLAKEINEYFDQGKKSYEDVNEMPYLEMFVSEMLRMYPVVERLERKCVKPYKLPNSDIVIPVGTIIGIPMGAIQHDEKYFTNQDIFDPERFSPEKKQGRNPYTYLPFGTGPRNCIGMRFALIEMKVALCCLLTKFKIEKIPQVTPDDVRVYRQFGLISLPWGLKVKMVPIQLTRP